MSLFKTALQAKIPFIGVRYADPVNFVAILQEIAGKSILALPKTKLFTVGDYYTYWTEDLKDVTTEMYRKLCMNGTSCVVLNQGPSTLVFDAGIMPTPTKFLVEYLQPFVEKESVNSIVQSIAGLSLKDSQNLVQLTMARTGSIQPSEIRKTRLLIGGHTPGLESMDTDLGFYVMPAEVESWVKLNDKYFLDETVPLKLIPRGLMVTGAPGVGKSSLSKALANHWKVPLFRVDISASLSRWLGDSESNIAKSLAQLDANAPCVALFDEVEKLFSVKGNEDTAGRILSQLLWWWQNHTSRVLTIMTSNAIESIPSEVYRPGRVDRVIEIFKLHLGAARNFALGAYKSVLGVEPTEYKSKLIWKALVDTNKVSFSHVEVIELVIELIKSKGWEVEEILQSNA